LGEKVSRDTYDALVQAQIIASEKVASVSEGLEYKLNQRSQDSTRMEYKQIKISARYVVEKLGHEWMLKEDSEDEFIRMYIRDEMRILVEKIAGKWHPQPDRVWLQFRDYCLKMAAAARARQEINKLQAQT
jgi:hypothetical protein